MTSNQEPLLLAIKQYLIDRLGFDSYFLFKINKSELISINQVPSRGNSNSQVFIGIENIRILYNYLIPFLMDLPFLTKKFKDFKDFIIICYIIYYKIYKDENIKNLVLKLSNNMNNFRLSSYNGASRIKPITDAEKNKLITATPKCKPLSDGRIININTQKLDGAIKGGSVFEITTPKGEIILANSLEECTKIVGVSRSHLSSSFSNTCGFTLNINQYNLKRIGVFLK